MGALVVEKHTQIILSARINQVIKTLMNIVICFKFQFYQRIFKKMVCL